MQLQKEVVTVESQLCAVHKLKYEVDFMCLCIFDFLCSL